jgi:3-dehydroquinate synthase
MVLAARLSAHLGMAAAADAERLRTLLTAFELPTALPAGLDANPLLDRMRLDKKANAAGLRFVLWEAPGMARIVDGVPEDAVLETLLAG